MNKVLVIGGGYGGLRAIESLASYKDIEITLIDKNPYHYLQTEAYGYIAGKYDVNDIAIDLQTWCLGFKRVKFIHKELQTIDFETSSISVDSEVLTFDYIIVAVGAKTNFFSFIKGLRENSYGVKNLERAFNFRNEFERAIYTKLQNENSSQTENVNIAIGGAGLSGVEVAAEMAYVIKNYSKTIGENAKSIKIYLIDASETILPGASNYIVTNTHSRLQKLGVEILTNAFISEVTESKIYFKNGEELSYHFMIFTGGIKASLFNDGIETQKNNLNQFIADEYLNILESQNIFAIGDCVEMRSEDGSILPPTAQSAERSAEYVAKVIRKRIDGALVDKFSMSMIGMFVALGGKHAVGEIFKFIKVKGYVAYLLKKAITYIYYLGLRFRINTGFKNRIKSKR
jgi:NADH:ubiquinone reductase (H+-translocating)